MSGVFTTSLVVRAVSNVKHDIAMQVPFGFIFIIMKTIFEARAEFLLSLAQVSESKHQRVPHKATSEQRASPSFYSKGQAGRIIFCSSRSQAEKNKAATSRNKSGGVCGGAQLLPEEGPGARLPKHRCPSKDGENDFQKRPW